MQVPDNYQRLDGSERRPHPTATLVGPADHDERVEVTIVLRRRTDGQPLPGPDHFLLPPGQRLAADGDEFAARYGASPEDIEQVTEFVTSHGLTVVDTHAARRTVVASGTVKQMSEAFAVDLCYYQHDVSRRRGEEPQTKTYRGRDGFIHVPQELDGVIVGVFGLDNRPITKQNSGDPGSTSAISVSTAASLYNFPTNSAAGQTIAIFSADGYVKSDITKSFAPGAAPTITDVSVDASNDGIGDYETTQDIYIAASAAPGAAIAVYFTTPDQKGWVDLVKRVAHPNAGDPTCSVLSSSYYISNGDDATTLANEGVSTAFLNALTDAFHDAALQSVTVCIASGDTGTDSKVRDGKAHVQYPASDPWVLSVGGTTIGNISGTAYDEYVWNDTFVISGSTYSGATGGGISDFFALPAYQNGAAVPPSLNDGTHVGRGVPDVAANASPNSGYPLTVRGSPFVGNGTSASAPLWAGLIAVLNASLGESVGFVNPVLYSLGSSVFRDIASPPGPADNGLNGVSGYPAGPGWDACTGWGSPNGNAILARLQQAFNKDCVFITDRSTFSSVEVAAMLKQTNPAVIPGAFYIQVDGFRPAELGITAASLSGVPNVYPTITPANPIPGMTVGYPAGKPSALLAQDPSLYPAPQRFTWVFPVSFSSTSGFIPGGQTITLTASIGGVSGSANIALVETGNPFEADGPVSWLSSDTRVFQVKTGQTLFNAGPMGTTPADASAFIKSVVSNLNANLAGPQTFDGLPADEAASELALYAVDQHNVPVWNFALARVRYRALVADAPDVRVFFRLCPALSVSVNYDANTTYKRSSVLNPDGQPIPVLGVQGGNLVTIPFFAEPRRDASQVSMNTQTDSTNVQTITHDGSGAEVDVYFGCWLDINQTRQLYPLNPAGEGPYSGPLKSILELVRNQHQCLLVEIAFDPDPIVGHPSPAVSDKLAQRNLQLVASANPGNDFSRRIPSAFELSPTQEELAKLRQFEELLISWGNVPSGSSAQIYLPTVSAAEVLALAGRWYGRHLLSRVDDHTVRCPVGQITYIPIPPGAKVNHTGLLTIDLPAHVRRGQLYKAVVQQITYASGVRVAPRPEPPEPPKPKLNWATQADGEHAAAVSRTIRWRSVRGSFQVSIPVRTKDVMLAPEEQTLSIFKWIQLSVPPSDRWYPVFTRYVEQLGQRVLGLGGDPSRIQPSPIGQGGQPPEPPPAPPPVVDCTGKVTNLYFDRFGDFTGFDVETAAGERRFISRERDLAALVERAWRDRIRVTVVATADAPSHPTGVVFRAAALTR